jgi:1D-myo-inositol-tetrakisphosphate 5-kinase/inositol-polyphosphate multikinase
VRKLEEIKDWFNRQTNFYFYSSSILIAYENYLENYYRDFYIENDYSNMVRIAMIDFTHVVLNSTNEIDNNYLFGLNNLINHLKFLLNTEYNFQYLES